MGNHEKRTVRFYQGNGKPFRSEKVSRNEKCRCGSGKKAKHCCGCETKYYSQKNEKSYGKN